MKFINRSTGVILEPQNEMVIEQLSKSAEYMVCEQQPAGNRPPKPSSKQTKAAQDQ